MDTQNDGLEKVTPLKWQLLVSMLVFWGVNLQGRYCCITLSGIPVMQVVLPKLAHLAHLGKPMMKRCGLHENKTV